MVTTGGGYLPVMAVSFSYRSAKWREEGPPEAGANPAVPVAR